MAYYNRNGWKDYSDKELVEELKEKESENEEARVTLAVNNSEIPEIIKEMDKRDITLKEECDE